MPARNIDDIQARYIIRSAFKQSSIMGPAEILQRYPYREDLVVALWIRE
ncbi:MAG: hypothetical protein WD750_12900 [Gammaproteobacteria bacterium]